MTISTKASKFAIAVHGGAGTILRKFMTDEKEAAYRNGLSEAMKAGHKILKSGGTALDATQAAVVAMEDNPIFNAGKGAVYTHDGDHEMDACIMDGATKQVGAVAAVRLVRNPIKLARLVLEHSPHILLGGSGAERFAEKHDIELVEDSRYFDTPERWRQLQQALKREKERKGQPQTQLDHSDDKDKMGTVGAVALDQHGDVAAATSTGGMTNKRFGRIGDTPIVGAGTYADKRCAISATGVGEMIMRAVLSHDIAALIEYKNMSLAEASELAVMTKFTELGGSGGVVAIDVEGNIAMPFNSKGMYRGYMLADGTCETAIFRD